MQIEELQQQWIRLDEKLERTVKMKSELLRLALVQPAKRRMGWLAFWPVLDIAFCAVILLFGGSFLWDHRDSLALVASASVLMLGGVLLLNFSIRQLVIASAMDWSRSVAEIQSSLAKLRIAKIQQFKWVMLTSPLVGFCGLLVGLQWLLDRLPEPQMILDKLNTLWVVFNVLFGLLLIPAGHAVVGVLAKRYEGRSWWQRALADIGGMSLKRIEDEMNQWKSMDEKLV